MKSISKLSKIALIVGASLTLAACGSSEEPETLQITQEVPDTPPAPPPPPTGGGDGSGSGDDGSGDDGSDEDDGTGGAGGDDGSDEGDGEPGQVLFEEDIAEDIAQSTPSDVNIPLGIQATLDVEYLGAFRVEAGGESSSNYAVGTLGYNAENDSLFMAGHAHHNAIAEFGIPTTLSLEETVLDIIQAEVYQNYETVLDKREEGNETNKITGLLHYNGNLLVSSEIWYDANGANNDNLQVFKTANTLQTSEYNAMLQLEGGALSAGYMSKVPSNWVGEIGSEYIVGWASNYSITSRYSQGPSMHTFSPQQSVDSVVTVDRSIDTTPLMVFPFEDGKELVDGGTEYKLDISPIWGPLSKAMYGFIVPETNYFLVVGSSGGINSGIGYKITQDDGNVCSGQCTYKANDNYNYFWIFDVNDILNAESPWSPRPISYGKWSHPYDQAGAHRVIGATFDDVTSRLFISLKEAGRTGEYDRPPLIISYSVTEKE
ncbi:MAG: hypothetical protein ABNH21_14310 [Glaciecola sp.]|jgi:hypothetical protein